MKHNSPHKELQIAKSFEKYLEARVEQSPCAMNIRLLTQHKEVVKELVERIINIENSLVTN
jgi:hypothetical protein